VTHPDFLGSVIGILSILCMYFLFTRADQFENGNIDKKDS